MTDIDLWNGALSGDMTAISLLYRENYSLMYNWGLKFVSDEDFVEDCIQDVFVKICSSRTLSPTQYVKGYLLTSLRNMIYDRIATTHEQVELNEQMFEIDEEDPAIMRMFDRDDETLATVKQLIASYNALTPNQRMGIYLKYVKGLSHKEIAVVLQMNPQSAMNLVSRALKSLRVSMGEKTNMWLLCLFMFIE